MDAGFRGLLKGFSAVCDISRPNDNIIDGLDLEVFVGNWLSN